MRRIQVHHAIQRLLRRKEVFIPCAEALAERLPDDRNEVRRFFPHLLSLISAVTLLYQFQRDQDDQGRLMSTPNDYETARRLMEGPAGRVLGNRLSRSARRCAERLDECLGGREFTTREAIQKCNASERAVRGWLRELHDAAWLDQLEPPRGSIPAKWRMVEPGQRTANCVLPTLEEVFPGLRFMRGAA
jgi:hypothetical protein